MVSFFVFTILLKMPVEVTPGFALSVSDSFPKKMFTISAGISVPTTFPLMSLPYRESCFQYDVLINPKSGFIQSFKTEIIEQCWHYCKLTTDCKFFSFHIIPRKCSLFAHNYKTRVGVFEWSKVVAAQMNCLECLGDVENISVKSQAGVLIEIPESGKCLAVSRTKVNASVDAGERFKLALVSCSKGNLWKVNRNEDQKSYRISLLESNWSLEWKLSPYGFGFVFLAKSSNNLRQKMYMDKSSWFPGTICRFSISGGDDDGIESGGWLLYNIEIYFPHTDNSLVSVSFILPTDNQSCSFKRMQVKNGVVLNDNNVPFLLPGSSETVRCKPGFGFKALNYSSHQTVECEENRRPNYFCSKIRISEEADDVILHKSYLLIIVLLSTFLCFSIALIVKGKLSNKVINDNKIGNGEIISAETAVAS